VEEGDQVNKGDVIARLSDRDCRADLRKTRAEVEAKQAQLKLLKAGARPEEIELAKTLVTKAEERIKYARSRVGMDKTLFDDRLISRREYEETQESLGLRQQELQEARDRLAVLLAGSRPEEIEATEAEIRRLTAHERYLQEQLALLTVVSPISGVVTTHKPKEKIGEHVGRGDLIAEVHELKTVTVEIAVPEKEIADVRVGQRIVLKARAHSQRQFESEVKAIAPIASDEDNPVSGHTVLVTTRLNNADALLKPAMTGSAKIYCGRQRLFDLVTRRFLRYLRVEFWSWW
jgi:multidrug resistance efflux pump